MSVDEERDRNRRPPTDVEHERWFRAYASDPERSVGRLAVLMSVRKARMLHAVTVGWPPTYPSLRDRLLASDNDAKLSVRHVTEEVQAGAIARVAIAVADGWESAARRHLKPLADVSEAIVSIAAELKIASREATFVGYRREPKLDEEGDPLFDGEGRPLTELKAFVDAESIARATARLAQAAKDHAILNKALLDSLNPMRDAAIDLSDAPPEALAYIRRKFG